METYVMWKKANEKASKVLEYHDKTIVTISMVNKIIEKITLQ